MTAEMARYRRALAWAYVIGGPVMAFVVLVVGTVVTAHGP